ncbi:e3 ubiquitin-protein ligase bre1 [Acrodontium crateriforme]|uniref:E3 ubiquitin protein ligase n=1 Tax=Acrodontium crateriforme TaxID=150365 RepID=A0AAQ3R7R1_9PEZI|nr:e3 ubiquitin-protein ligase bre1 [Acrodontium crateriforme]
MTATQVQPVAVPSLHKAKMEDRKRALAPDADDLAPSRKRVVKDENGQAMRMDDDKEKNIENFQKDAILRQMKEYKRQKKDFEDQYRDLQKRCEHHDDHLRTIDGWFAQLLDEIRLCVAEALPTPPPSASSATGQELYGSALLFENNERFSEHLHARSANIKSAISDLFGRLPSSAPEVEALRKQLNQLLANEKEHAVALRSALDDQQLLNERLETACIRYMTAEKKLDRVKSAQIQKLEQQAIMGGNGESASSKKSSTPKNEHEDSNGIVENGLHVAEIESARKEAMAVADKRKSQLDEVEAENERLTNELSAARTKLVSLTDDDYAATSLFKLVKLKYEEIINRVNSLEALNVQLKEEAQKLHAERNAYKSQVEEETRYELVESETQRARTETDLARVRNVRDDLASENDRYKKAEATRMSSADQTKELAEARQIRITSLESEVERLKLQLGESTATGNNYDELDVDALREKLKTVDNQYSLLSNELPSMELAWKKAQTLASRKNEEIASWQEQIARLNAEKTKAEQKFFATMKAKEMRDGELRALKSQNARASEIVSQLKDNDSKTRELVQNLERQIAEARDNFTTLEQQTRATEQKSKEAIISAEVLRKHVDDLKAMVSQKDKEVQLAAKAKRVTELELETCKSKLDDTKKQYDSLRKSKAALSDNDNDDGWRRLAICTVCNTRIRNTALKLCGHVFCHECVNDLVKNRNRKCPSCAKAFGNADFMGIVLA